jgi:hypothetical protein
VGSGERCAVPPPSRFHAASCLLAAHVPRFAARQEAFPPGRRSTPCLRPFRSTSLCLLLCWCRESAAPSCQTSTAGCRCGSGSMRPPTTFNATCGGATTTHRRLCLRVARVRAPSRRHQWRPLLLPPQLPFRARVALIFGYAAASAHAPPRRCARTHAHSRARTSSRAHDCACTHTPHVLSSKRAQAHRLHPSQAALNTHQHTKPNTDLHTQIYTHI